MKFPEIKDIDPDKLYLIGTQDLSQGLGNANFVLSTIKRAKAQPISQSSYMISAALQNAITAWSGSLNHYQSVLIYYHTEETGLVWNFREANEMEIAYYEACIKEGKKISEFPIKCMYTYKDIPILLQTKNGIEVIDWLKGSEDLLPDDLQLTIHNPVKGKQGTVEFLKLKRRINENKM